MVIYSIVCKSNSKIYIGLTRNFKRRKTKHLYYLRRNYHVNKHLQNAFNLYGECNFLFTIIESVDCECNLTMREKYYIDKLKTNQSEFGFNLTSGGEYNIVISEETKYKLYLKNIGKKLSTEHKNKIGISNSDKKISDEQKKILSNKMKIKWSNGKYDFALHNLKSHTTGEFKHTEETKNKLSKIRKGKTYDEIYGDRSNEIKEKIRQLNIGDKNAFYKDIDLEYVRNQIENGLTINEISKIIKCSKPTIIKKFKEKFKMSITEYKEKLKTNERCDN